MTNTNVTPGKVRFSRGAILGATALALVLGGAIFGEPLHLTRTVPAFADPVQVEGVAPVSFADVVEQVRPAVVSVRVRAQTVSGNDMFDLPFFDLPPGSPMERFFRQFRDQNPQLPRPQLTTSLGSGFFISDDGYVVTNNHVIDTEQSVTVITDSGAEYDARVVGTDDKTDLALLKIDDPGTKFTYVKFAEAEPRVGDWVVAVGNPFGLGGTVTAGIISARGRNIGAGPYDDFLQIDAAVNRGNSGGPAFNFKGEVVGVNTAIFSPSGGNVGIAFAIPSSIAQNVINSLKDNGSIVRGWLGIQIQSITPEIAASLRLPSDKGALVADVTADGPAAKAGLVARDAITAVNGTDVADSRDLALRISNTPPGQSVTVTYWRDGAEHQADVTLGTLPSDRQLAALQPSPDRPPQATSLNDFGLALAPSSDNIGVVVTDVDPNGQAAERGLQSGDVILTVGERTVSNPQDVQTAIAQAKASGLEAVLLKVQSGDRTMFVALRLS